MVKNSGPPVASYPADDRNAAARLDEDEKGVRIKHTLGGAQSLARIARVGPVPTVPSSHPKQFFGPGTNRVQFLSRPTEKHWCNLGTILTPHLCQKPE